MVNAMTQPTPLRVASGGRRRTRAGVAKAGKLRFAMDPMRLTISVTMILTVSRIHQHYSFFAKFRPVLLLVFASAAYAYLYPRYLTRVNVLRLWPMQLVAALSILACGSAVFGISLGGSASFILNDYMKTVIYAFLVAVSVRNIHDLYTFIWAYVISCGILNFFSLFVFHITQNAGSYVSRLDHLDTYDSNDLCVVLLVGLALTLLLLQVARGRVKLLLLLNLVGIAASIARSGSRGGFIGIIVFGVAALFLINSISVSARIGFVFAAAAALILGAPPGYWKQMGTVLEPKSDYNYSARDGRKALMHRGIGYMSAYPYFGIGINNFSKAECTISPKLKDISASGPIRCTAPHNSYVQAGAELGVPGLVVWASLVIGGVVALLRLRGRLPRRWRRGSDAERFAYASTHFLPLAMVGFAVSAFFVSFAWMDPIYILAALITGLYISLRAVVPSLSRQESATLAHGLGMIKKTVSGWRVRKSAQCYRPGEGISAAE